MIIISQPTGNEWHKEDEQLLPTLTTTPAARDTHWSVSFVVVRKVANGTTNVQIKNQRAQKPVTVEEGMCCENPSTLKSEEVTFESDTDTSTESEEE